MTGRFTTPPAMGLPIVVTATGFATSSLAQTLGQGASAAIPLWRVLAALGFCLCLAVLAAVTLRLRTNGGKGKAAGFRAFADAMTFKLPSFPKDRRVRLIETTRVSPQLEICLFAFDGQHFLIAATPQGVVVLDRGAAVLAPGSETGG